MTSIDGYAATFPIGESKKTSEFSYFFRNEGYLILNSKKITFFIEPIALFLRAPT